MGKTVKGRFCFHFPVIHILGISKDRCSCTCLAYKKELTACDYLIENIIQSNNFWKIEYSVYIYIKMHVDPYTYAHITICVTFTTAVF